MQNILKSCCFNWLKSTYSPPTWATIIAGVFVVVTLILSVYLLFEHLSAYKNPEVSFFIFKKESKEKFIRGNFMFKFCFDCVFRSKSFWLEWCWWCLVMLLNRLVFFVGLTFTKCTYVCIFLALHFAGYPKKIELRLGNSSVL